MLKKRLRTIIAFHTTADAMAFESACKQERIDGKLIPVPRTISAGCGLAYSANPDEKERIKLLLIQTGIEEEALCDCMV